MASSYSKYFSLDQLTKTDTGLPNKPQSADLTRLAHLGRVLDTMYEKIGPFKIVSAYRAPAVQSALKSSGNKQAVSVSYHSTGQAADIMPINANINDYFSKIIANTTVKNMLGGFAIKSNVIHIDTDTTKRQGVAMWVDKVTGAYIRFTPEQLRNFLSKNKVAIGGGLIVMIGLGIAAYMMMKKRK